MSLLNYPQVQLPLAVQIIVKNRIHKLKCTKNRKTRVLVVRNLSDNKLASRNMQMPIRVSVLLSLSVGLSVIDIR
jgi:hypothetical protein